MSCPAGSPERFVPRKGHLAERMFQEVRPAGGEPSIAPRWRSPWCGKPTPKPFSSPPRTGQGGGAWLFRSPGSPTSMSPGLLQETPLVDPRTQLAVPYGGGPEVSTDYLPSMWQRYGPSSQPSRRRIVLWMRQFHWSPQVSFHQEV